VNPVLSRWMYLPLRAMLHPLVYSDSVVTSSFVITFIALYQIITCHVICIYHRLQNWAFSLWVLHYRAVPQFTFVSGLGQKEEARPRDCDIEICKFVKKNLLMIRSAQRSHRECRLQPHLVHYPIPFG